MIETAMAFFRHDVLGNYLAGVLVGGTVWSARCILRRWRTSRQDNSTPE
jgi:hypothetical protein